MPPESASQLAKELYDYMYDRLLGQQQNARPIYQAIKSPQRLPTDIMKSIAKLVAVLTEPNGQQIDELLTSVEGNIMVAQTMSFLTADSADKALGILDHIRDTFDKGK